MCQAVDIASSEQASWFLRCQVQSQLNTGHARLLVLLQELPAQHSHAHTQPSTRTLDPKPCQLAQAMWLTASDLDWLAAEPVTAASPPPLFNLNTHLLRLLCTQQLLVGQIHKVHCLHTPTPVLQAPAGQAGLLLCAACSLGHVQTDLSTEHIGTALAEC